jgi:hypothetical protein
LHLPGEEFFSYNWASFRSKKGGVKVHTMYDIKKQMPDFMIITEARKHDHTPVVNMPFRNGALYVLDREYLCFKTLQNINKIGSDEPYLKGKESC